MKDIWAPLNNPTHKVVETIKMPQKVFRGQEIPAGSVISVLYGWSGLIKTSKRSMVCLMYRTPDGHKSDMDIFGSRFERWIKKGQIEEL